MFTEKAVLKEKLYVSAHKGRKRKFSNQYLSFHLKKLDKKRKSYQKQAKEIIKNIAKNQ